MGSTEGNQQTLFKGIIMCTVILSICFNTPCSHVLTLTAQPAFRVSFGKRAFNGFLGAKGRRLVCDTEPLEMCCVLLVVL